MEPLISIIIPVYNRVNLLPKVLESIKNQTYKNIEVIIVDDGSQPAVHSSQFQPKAGPPLADLVYSDDLSIKLIRQENMGAPVARNRGLAEAKGEYVIFWDADVIGRPEMLEKLKRQLDLHTETSYAYCNYQFSITNFQKKIRAKIFNFQDLKKNNFVHSTSLIRMKDVVRWDESIKRFQDWDLWLTMLEQGKIGVWVDEYLFTVLGGGIISKWLPRIAYRAPFKCLPFVSKSVREYEEAKKVIIQKHKLSTI